VSDSQENDIQHLGSIDGAQVAVVASGLEQRILVQHSESGQHLVRLLGFEPERLPAIQAGNVRSWSLPHDVRVDDLLRTLIDILISIRYLHPSFVQLRLDLTDDTL
jgi:hypothetical protein